MAGESEFFFWRFGEGSLGVGDDGMGVEAAALCMNFIVSSLDDMALGALPGVLAGLDILAENSDRRAEKLDTLRPPLLAMLSKVIVP